MTTENRSAATAAEGRPTASVTLLEIGSEAELFHNERGEAFARFPVGAHWEIRPLRSRAFTDWLSLRFFETEGKPPPPEAISSTLGVLAGIAVYQRGEVRLWVRVGAEETKGTEGTEGAGGAGGADCGEGVWYDLADADWRAVFVGPDGWKLVADPPILFRRHAPLDAQVAPEPGGDIEALRSFLNVREEDDWRLLVAWMVSALLPSIAHPVLALHGEQGSSKSTTARLLGSLIDPSAVPLRAEPRDIEQWIQAADHSWLVTLDNLSRIPVWLSDALCRSVTGEAFLSRTLYTDQEDSLAEFKRVVILTGIESMASRPDLLDRSILLRLEPIGIEKRKSETALLSGFEAERPRLFGALLTLVSAVLKELPEVKIQGLPRMADFARVGIALERVCGWPEGAFRTAHQRNSGQQNDEAIMASPIGEILIEFTKSFRNRHKDAYFWEGTATELMWELSAAVGSQRPKNWPRDGRAVVSELRRLAPNLRPAGIEIGYARTAAARIIRIWRWREGERVTG